MPVSRGQRARLRFCTVASVLWASPFWLPASWALNNGASVKPAMGWNTWNSYACEIDEPLILQSAQAMIDYGLVDLGYTYVNMDDCWQADNRTEDGQILADPAKFPSGIGQLADKVHALGLKFGIYSDSGNYTCGGRPGSLGFEVKDADTYAEWGVDYLKYDNCYNWGADPIMRYTVMSDALLQSKRQVLLSICEWGVLDPWTWAGPLANSWRTTDDIQNNYEAMLRVVDDSLGLGIYAGPGHWNDLDMLEVGNNGMFFWEEQAHFAIWAAVKSPLILGNDVRNMTEDTLSIIRAEEVIAINQDDLGVPADLVFQEGPRYILAGPLADGTRVAILWNRHTHDNAPEYFQCDSWLVPRCRYQVKQTWPGEHMTLDFHNLGFNSTTECVVRDLYQRKDLGTFTGSFSAFVPNHGVLALKVTPTNEQDLDTEWRPWFEDPTNHVGHRQRPPPGGPQVVPIGSTPAGGETVDGTALTAGLDEEETPPSSRTGAAVGIVVGTGALLAILVVVAGRELSHARSGGRYDEIGRDSEAIVPPGSQQQAEGYQTASGRGLASQIPSQPAVTEGIPVV